MPLTYQKIISAARGRMPLEWKPLWHFCEGLPTQTDGVILFPCLGGQHLSSAWYFTRFCDWYFIHQILGNSYNYISFSAITFFFFFCSCCKEDKYIVLFRIMWQCCRLITSPPPPPLFLKAFVVLCNRIRTRAPNDLAPSPLTKPWQCSVLCSSQFFIKTTLFCSLLMTFMTALATSWTL